MVLNHHVSPLLGLPDVHQRWALVWLACLLLAALLFLLLLFKKDHIKGEKRVQILGKGAEGMAELTQPLHPSVRLPKQGV